MTNNDATTSSRTVELAQTTFPRLKKGILKKQSRGENFFKNWRSRYFVLDEGVLFYYEKKLDTNEMPFGENLKGKMDLFDAIIIDIKESVFHRMYIVCNFGKGNDILLEANTAEDLVGWKKAIKAHIAYAKTKGSSSVPVEDNSIESDKQKIISKKQKKSLISLSIEEAATVSSAITSTISSSSDDSDVTETAKSHSPVYESQSTKSPIEEISQFSLAEEDGNSFNNQWKRTVLFHIPYEAVIRKTPDIHAREVKRVFNINVAVHSIKKVAKYNKSNVWLNCLEGWILLSSAKTLPTITVLQPTAVKIVKTNLVEISTQGPSLLNCIFCNTCDVVKLDLQLRLEIEYGTDHVLFITRNVKEVIAVQQFLLNNCKDSELRVVQLMPFIDTQYNAIELLDHPQQLLAFLETLEYWLNTVLESISLERLDLPRMQYYNDFLRPNYRDMEVIGEELSNQGGLKGLWEVV